MSYDWPGNVRELENAVERAVVLGTTDRIEPEDLPEAITETTSSNEQSLTEYHTALKQAKRQIILNAIAQTEGNYTEAAKILGIHPNNLHRLMRNIGLKTSSNK